MASLPDPVDNFAHGLVDFWAAFFRDLPFTENFMGAAQVQLGQAFLDLMDASLGVSLDHAPLYSGKYFKLLAVREDRVVFAEGASTADDRWIYHEPGVDLAAAPLIVNRVAAPTTTLQAGRDYAVRDGGVAFATAPFDTAPFAGFPLRRGQVQFLAAAKRLRGGDWKDTGVRAGDTLRVTFMTGRIQETAIRMVQGNLLALDGYPVEWTRSFLGQPFAMTVLRTPYDARQTARPVAAVPRRVDAATVASVNAGTKTVTLAAAPSGVTLAIGQYLYLADAATPTNADYARITNVGGLVLTVDRPNNFAASAGPWTAAVVDFGTGGPTSATPAAALEHTVIDAASFTLTGRRVVGTTVDGVAYPAGGALLDGVDYVLDAENGELIQLTPWDPTAEVRASYTWRLVVATETHLFRGAFAALTGYAAGDVVASGGRYYVAKTGFNSGGSFVANDWIELAHPFVPNAELTVREIACWAVDAAIDRSVLDANFGVLLGYRRPSSEAYRAFLKGAMRLFLLGPSIGHLESALNVAAGFPVVREDHEVFTGVTTDYLPIASGQPDPTRGVGGRVFDVARGRDGVFTGATFSSPTAGFFPDVDAGTVLTIRTADGFVDYVVTAVAADGGSATVTPTPPADAANLDWRYRHNAQNRVFRAVDSAVDRLFTDADVGSYVVVATAANNHNVGAFPIQAVLSPRDVVLDAPYGLIDEDDLVWRLSPSLTQTVTTSKRDYVLPVSLALRDEFLDPANAGVLELPAFATFTDAIRVVDYLVDPTWWHHVTIPDELLGLDTASIGRRRVTPQLIPHVFDSLDGATPADFVAVPGRDDDGGVGILREGAARWLGGPWVRLLWADPMPRARTNDVGTYFNVSTAFFTGAYKILETSPDGQDVRLERFPPPEAAGFGAPYDLTGNLQPLLYRHTVAWVIMDRVLKYHSFQIEVDALAPVSANFLSDASSLVRDAKPAHNYVFLEPQTAFTDTLALADALDVLYGPEWVDRAWLVDNAIRGNTGLGADEFHCLVPGAVTGVLGAPGPLTITLAPTWPFTPDRVVYLLGKFADGENGGRLLSEGVDYTFDYATGVATVPHADAGNWDFRYLACLLTAHAPATPWWTGVADGETPSCVHGPDVLVRRDARAVATLGTVQIVDRPIEFTFSS